MIIQGEYETRLNYLLRVVEEFCLQNGECKIEYDDSLCDGYYLAQDIQNLKLELDEE